MEDKTEIVGSYKVGNILLMNFDFWRREDIDFDKQEIQNSVDISTEIGTSVDSSMLSVAVILSVNSTLQEEKIFSIKIKMAGSFIKEGTPALSEDIFKKVNAPAIIYPFIREQVATTCLKAGLTKIFLPPVNFIERNKVT